MDTHRHTDTHKYSYTHIYTQRHTDIHTDTNTQTHTYIHTETRTHTDTQAHRDAGCGSHPVVTATSLINENKELPSCSQGRAGSLRPRPVGGVVVPGEGVVSRWQIGRSQVRIAWPMTPVLSPDSRPGSNPVSGTPRVGVPILPGRSPACGTGLRCLLLRLLGHLDGSHPGRDSGHHVRRQARGGGPRKVGGLPAAQQRPRALIVLGRVHLRRCPGRVLWTGPVDDVVGRHQPHRPSHPHGSGAQTAQGWTGVHAFLGGPAPQSLASCPCILAFAKSILCREWKLTFRHQTPHLLKLA